MTSPDAARADDALARLAAAHGVATSYDDWSGRRVQVGTPAVVAVLDALDVDASTPDAVRAALADVEDRPWRRLVDPFTAVRRPGGAAELVVRPATGAAAVVEVHLEEGASRVLAGGSRAPGRSGRDALQVALPHDLPDGWHRVRVRAGEETGEGVLLVAPRSLPSVEERSWGWALQLYALRSSGSWAVGDYADLRALVAAARDQGAGLVLVNPLHAEVPVEPVQPSPYSPSSRRFRSLLGLRVEDVPEHRDAPGELQAQVAALRPAADPDRVDRDAALASRLGALELLWPRHRAEELAAFRAAEGRALEDHALFCALAERHGGGWQEWPEELRDPASPAVAAARAELADRVAFWCWIQLLVTEQLEAVAAVAQGMAVGVVHDLAVGVDAGGADGWALQDVLALGTSVGAPPDSFNQQGQDWGLPPWRPDRLHEAGYEPLRGMVRGVLRSAGGLRVDHVMGLFRTWWVPAGRPASEGTYVAYDADAMLAVVALEAARAGAVVVGEDLGTVEDRVRDELSASGVLGSAVLWFERDGDRFSHPGTWRRDAMASVTTHDLPTAAGWLAGEHVAVRARLGLLGRPEAEERAEWERERGALVAALHEWGFVSDDGDLVDALHRALAAAPSRLVTASLSDAVRDLAQPNLPGTTDAYPSWVLPVRDASGRPLLLDELLASDGVRRTARLLAGERGPIPPAAAAPLPSAPSATALPGRPVTAPTEPTDDPNPSEVSRR